MAGVWPLRIPGNVTAIGDQLTTRPPFDRYQWAHSMLRSRQPTARILAFPADCPHRTDCHSPAPAHVGCDTASTAGYSGFPANSQLLFAGSLPQGAGPGRVSRVFYLRTVIVTAAVYRGLGSELRPEGLTPPRNLPAPGRRHSVYIVLGLRTLLCFY